MPLVSIIVPVYNAEAYLERTVNSILAQTLADWELIFVDDGSTDASGDMCDAFAAQDERVRVVHKVNGGLSSARNAGIKQAKGDYIGFVDADDYILPQMYETLHAKALETGEAVVKCSIIRVAEDMFQPGVPLTEAEIVPTADSYDVSDGIISDRDFVRNLAVGMRDSSVCNLLIKKSVCKSIRFLDKTFYEDAYFSLELAQKVPTFCLVGRRFYLWIKHAGSMSDSIGAKEWLDLALYNMRLFKLCGKFEDMEDCKAASFHTAMTAAEAIAPDGFGAGSAEVAKKLKVLSGFLEENKPHLAEWNSKGYI